MFREPQSSFMENVNELWWIFFIKNLKKLAKLPQLIWKKVWSRIFKISTHNDTHKMLPAFKTILTKLSWMRLHRGGTVIKVLFPRSKGAKACVSISFPSNGVEIPSTFFPMVGSQMSVCVCVKSVGIFMSKQH